jgi:purine nucleosidase
MTPRQIVLDTDVGIDDALMVLWVAAEPGVELVAIGSCHGNCDEITAARNAIRVLDAIGRGDVPVAVGEPSPMPQPIEALHVHGSDGLGDAGIPGPSREPSSESAVDQLIRLSRERPGELDLLAVGALTNLAAALARDPEVLGRFRSVTTLGGYSSRPGPGEKNEDFNTLASPAAADRVFAAGANLTVVPIDTTFRVIFSEAQLNRILTGTTPATRLSSAILPCYLDFHEGRYGHRTIPVHDPTAAAVLLYPDVFQATERNPVIVEPAQGQHWAVGVAASEAGYPEDRASATIITDVDAGRLLDRLVDALVNPTGALPSIA